MMVEALGFLPPTSASLPSPDSVPAPVAANTFSAWFTEQISQVNQQLVTADHSVQQLAAGQATNLHQVMIDLEEAKLSMQLLSRMTTQMIDSYRELLQMQI